jgi:hypothetical protein
MPYEVEGELCCWLWTGRTDRDGTPVIRTRASSTTARRHYWIRENGPIPEGQILYSHCQEKLCVRLSHHEPVSWREWHRRSARTHVDRLKAWRMMCLRAEGATQQEVGEIFNVDRSVVRAIERGEHWVVTDS